VAIVDGHEDLADRATRLLQPHQKTPIRPCHRLEDLLEAGGVDAALVASRTADHDRHARLLVDAGCRVLLEKPLTDSVETARELVRYLDGDERGRRAVMQAFMRRFDEPLCRARALVEDGAVGKPFKVVSILEDPCPPPAGYHSPGILSDMSVHNVDEAIWLLGACPTVATALGSNLHNHRISPVAEDFDDVLMQMRFPDGVLAQVQVSRNHVAGYRNETWIFGDEGVVHVGAFQEDPLLVLVEAFDRKGLVSREAFRMRDYGPEAPMFMHRFGPAYAREAEHFVEQCRKDAPFSVTHRDGLNAMLAVEAGMRSLRTGERDVPIEGS
jgi:predicted dehydrogenase